MTVPLKSCLRMFVDWFASTRCTRLVFPLNDVHIVAYGHTFSNDKDFRDL